MRKRSGAIHSDTQQGFIQLASASQDKTGIFYDPHVNRRIMKLIQNIRLPLDHQIAVPAIQKESEAVRLTNCFQGFDFGLEHEEDRQEREELERIKTTPCKQVNIGIISLHPQETMHQLCMILKVDAFQDSSRRGVDLIIRVEGQTIFKYWVFDRKILQLKQQNMLLELYLCHCSILIDFGDANCQMDILKTKLEDKKILHIKQNMIANLYY